MKSQNSWADEVRWYFNFELMLQWHEKQGSLVGTWMYFAYGTDNIWGSQRVNGRQNLKTSPIIFASWYYSCGYASLHMGGIFRYNKGYFFEGLCGCAWTNPMGPKSREVSFNSEKKRKPKRLEAEELHLPLLTWQWMSPPGRHWAK